RPTATGSSSIAKCLISCSTLSSKTLKCSFSRPVTGRLKGSQTVTGTSTKFRSTRKFAGGCLGTPAFAPSFGRGVVCTSCARATSGKSNPSVNERRVADMPAGIVLPHRAYLWALFHRATKSARIGFGGGESSQVVGQPQSRNQVPQSYDQPLTPFFPS